MKDYYGLLGLPQRGEAQYQSFLAKLAVFVAWLLEHKYTVRLLLGDTLYDNRVKDELLASLATKGWTAHDGQLINDPISSNEDVLAQLAATDIVVSARFHNVLLALMLHKPVISLSYHEKFASLVAGVGLADYSHDIDHLDIDLLTAQVVDLASRPEQLHPQLQRKVEEYRRTLDMQYGRIFACPVDSDQQ